MPPTGKPLNNAAWLITERLLRAVATVLVLGLVARHLGSADFGLLLFSLSFVTLAATPAALGLETLLVAEMLEGPEKTPRLLGSALRLRLLAGILVYAVAAALVFVVPAWRPAAAPILLAGLSLLFLPADVFSLWFERHLRAGSPVRMRLAIFLLGCLLRVLLVLLQAPLSAFALLVSCEAALSALGLRHLWRKHKASGAPASWDPTLARHLLRRGLPLALASLVVVVSLRIDQFLVQAFCPAEACGAYLAACRLLELALFVAAALSNSLLPSLADAKKQGPSFFAEKTQALFDGFSALGWVFALALCLGGPTVIRLAFGAAYQDGGTALQLLAWGALFAMNASARWQWILLCAPSRVNLVSALLGLAVQVLLGLLLLPAWGILGAAAAWSLAALASGWLSSWLLPDLRPCAAAQWRSLLIPLAPGRWKAMFALFLR